MRSASPRPTSTTCSVPDRASYEQPSRGRRTASWKTSDAARKLSFVNRRLQMFDVINAHPNLALTALLAIDQDPEYRPLPFLDETRVDYQAGLADGEIPPDIDIEALHLLSLTVAIGMAVYGQSAARQIGADVRELRDECGPHSKMHFAR